MNTQNKHTLWRIFKRFVSNAWLQALFVVLNALFMYERWPNVHWIWWVAVIVNGGFVLFFLLAAYWDWGLYRTFRKAYGRQEAGRKQR